MADKPFIVTHRHNFDTVQQDRNRPNSGVVGARKKGKANFALEGIQAEMGISQGVFIVQDSISSA